MEEDAVTRAVNSMLRLEPTLKGRESQIAVVIVMAISDLMKERGEPLPPAPQVLGVVGTPWRLDLVCGAISYRGAQPHGSRYTVDRRV